MESKCNLGFEFYIIIIFIKVEGVHCTHTRDESVWACRDPSAQSSRFIGKSK